MLKLYMHPVSNTSRPIRLLIAENKLPVNEVIVDLMTGEHLKEPYTKLNPNGLVPTLVDDDFVLTESSAILKYLADKFNLALYPKDLKQRARVNEMMDWFNTGFYRDYGYGVVYPQIYPHHKRPSDDLQKGTIEWGKTLTKKWLKVAERRLARQGQQVPDRRPDDDRRHLRRRALDLRPRHPRRLQGLSEHRPLAEERRRAGQLEQDQRSHGRLPQGGGEPGLRQRVTWSAAASRRRRLDLEGRRGRRPSATVHPASDQSTSFDLYSLRGSEP